MTHVRAHVRPMVMPMVRGVVGPQYGGSTYHDGISYNAETGRVVLKATGSSPTITTLTSAFTFTGGNQSMYMGPAGLLVQSVTNTPRIEYDANGNCLGLLMEASRTNLCVQSENISAWASDGASVSSNSTTAPSGSTTADTVIENTTPSTTHGRYIGVTITADTTTTISCWVKAKERTKGFIQLADAATHSIGFRIEFDLTAVSVSGAALTTGTYTSSTITPYPNGWYRITGTGKIGGVVTAANMYNYLRNDAGSVSYTGDGSSGLYYYGNQVEHAAFASSHIPTTTTSVARTADTCIRTLGSEFSATAGTVVVQGRASGGQEATSGQLHWSMTDGSGNERYGTTRPAASDVARYIVVDGGVAQVALDSTFVNNTNFRMAVVYTLNDFAMSFNGSVVLTDPIGTLPTPVEVHIGSLGGSSQANGHIRRFDYWPERKTNAYLQLASA